MLLVFFFKGSLPNWTTEGCETVEENNSVTCQCTHLSFFAVLLSQPQGTISAANMMALSYISYMGCGLSLIFLGVTLFSHFILRKARSSQATQILIQLFVAMFILNLTFLSNDGITSLGNMVACEVIAALMHYSMLSTFTWFFIEAFHLYLQLANVYGNIEHYMMKIYITGWVLPAPVVFILLSLGKYGYLRVYSNDGTSTVTCWIPDQSVFYGVNVGYYGLVFIVTLAIFVVVVQRLLLMKQFEMDKTQLNSRSKTTLTILGLLSLLGITWGFAFFSYGAMLLPSYYIFTVLNSLQGFFLFLYYCNTYKIIGEEKIQSTSNKVLTNN